MSKGPQISYLCVAADSVFTKIHRSPPPQHLHSVRNEGPITPAGNNRSSPPMASDGLISEVGASLVWVMICGPWLLRSQGKEVPCGVSRGIVH